MTSTGKKISAIIKCHNEELFLRECLESISPFVDDIVFVDNNSTDASVEIASQFKVRMVEYKHNPGGDQPMSHFYNWCNDQAAGEYVLHWDADHVALDFAPILQLLAEEPDAVRYPLWNLRGDHRHLWTKNKGVVGPKPWLHKKELTYNDTDTGMERLDVRNRRVITTDQFPALHMNLKSDERYFLRRAICTYRLKRIEGQSLEQWAKQQYANYDDRVRAEYEMMLRELMPYNGSYPKVLERYLARPKWLIESHEGRPVARRELW